MKGALFTGLLFAVLFGVLIGQFALEIFTR